MLHIAKIRLQMEILLLRQCKISRNLDLIYILETIIEKMSELNIKNYYKFIFLYCSYECHINVIVCNIASSILS